jgi:endoplasmic reticulum chaperone BiP
MRNTIEDKEKLADKIDEDDKNSIQDALSEAADWLSSNDDADKDDLEEHMKELQRVCDPIIAKVYQESGG